MTPPTPIVLLLVGVAALIPPITLAHPEPTPTAHPAHNHEDGSYAFAYAVDAPDYQNFHDREEARLGQETRGRFRVALPDNRLQTVTYTADGSGYTASVTYDVHPNFESLRQAIGPIRPAPEIGQSVLEGIRRGENWKHHKGPKHDGGHHASQNSVSAPHHRPSPTPTVARQRPRPSAPQSAPRPQPTRVRPSPTPQAPRRRPTSHRTNSGPSPPHAPATSAVRAPTRAPAARPTPTPHARPTPTPHARPTSPSRRPRPSARPTSPSSSRPTDGVLLPSISSADSEDMDILNRLILAIRKKLEDEGVVDRETHRIVKDEECDEEGKRDKKYIIGDKASVLRRLSGIVHPVELDSVHAHG